MRLGALVRSYLLAQGETEHKYVRFLQIAIDCLNEMNLDVDGVTAQTHLPVSPLDTAVLPKDYIKYIRIGICDKRGNIHQLGLNSSMCFNDTFDKCGTPTNSYPQPNPNNSQGGEPFLEVEGLIGSWDGWADNYRNGEFTGRLFGLGGGNNQLGYYKINTAKNVIQFQGLCKGAEHISMEYLADRHMIDGEFEVHPYLYETLKAWMWWKYIERNIRIGLGAIQLAEKSYYNAKRLSKARFMQQTISEWEQALRVANTSTLKF